jgi:hypothetical protein
MVDPTYFHLPSCPKIKGIPILPIFLTTFFLISILFVYLIHYYQGVKFSEIYTILYINDIHLDWLYNENCSSADQCHTSQTKFSSKYGIFGYDSPYTLYDSALSGAKSYHPSPTIIILGGDSISYALYPNMEDIINTTKYVLNQISLSFPSIPIYPLLRNNEFVPNYGFHHNSSIVYKRLSPFFRLILHKSKFSERWLLFQRFP